MECIFCRILAGEIPSTIVHRDEEVAAIVDVNPQAPTHLLVMPVRHVASLGDLADSEYAELLTKVFRIAARLGRERSAQGFRTVVNTGAAAGQTVDHLHVHVLGGRQMHWPPG